MYLYYNSYFNVYIQHVLLAFKNFCVPTDAREGARLALVFSILVTKI